MLTIEQVLADWAKRDRGGADLIDGRDASRLARYIPVEQWHIIGCELREGAEKPTPQPWTREEILKDVEHDVAFGFEKALNKRGISAGLMHSVVRMWMWILEEPYPDGDENYPEYGLPLFKAAALRFGFENPIGDDVGNEFKYSAEADR